jgi:hypothetical protein
VRDASPATEPTGGATADRFGGAAAATFTGVSPDWAKAIAERETTIVRLAKADLGKDMGTNPARCGVSYRVNYAWIH